MELNEFGMGSSRRHMEGSKEGLKNWADLCGGSLERISGLSWRGIFLSSGQRDWSDILVECCAARRRRH